ncbi:MAG: insulinase family protein [Spirochaetes bacterium]|nr:insulinase family protein [Spirochaetota bacterium]
MRKYVLIASMIAFSFLNAEKISLPVESFALSNGLKVVIVKNEDVAVVSCRLYYFVGSMYEGPGTSGLSHMYEHMMFKGTKILGTKDYKKELPYIKKMDAVAANIQKLKDAGASDDDARIVEMKKEIYSLLAEQRKYIKKDEIWETYQKNGGSKLNAWTSDYLTAYLVTLPKNKVELFYWIESDRMQNPVLREFYSERDVVAEERRMRYDNQPVSSYYENLLARFYTVHPFRIPTIGYMSDIQSYTRSKMEEHVRRYYTPDNAMIVLSGNIDAKKARADIEKYFGKIPRAEKPKQTVVTREPEPAGETRFIVRGESEPRIDIMFHIPPYPHNDVFTLDVIEGILGGRSGRLYKRLVDDEKLCTDADASNSFRLHGGYFIISASLIDGADPSAVERIIYDEIDKVKTTLPSDNEMERVKNSIRYSYLSSLKSLESISDQIARFQALGDWKGMFDYTDRIISVKKDELPAAASKYLVREKQTAGVLISGKTSSERK